MSTEELSLRRENPETEAESSRGPGQVSDPAKAKRPERPTPVNAAAVSAQEKQDSVRLQLIYYSPSLVPQNQRLCHTHPKALLTLAVWTFPPLSQDIHSKDRVFQNQREQGRGPRKSVLTARLGRVRELAALQRGGSRGTGDSPWNADRGSPQSTGVSHECVHAHTGVPKRYTLYQG